MEKRYIGPRSMSFLGLNTGTLDLTVNGWGHQVCMNIFIVNFPKWKREPPPDCFAFQRGLAGEKLEVFNEKGSKQVSWTKAQGPSPALTWFKVIPGRSFEMIFN